MCVCDVEKEADVEYPACPSLPLLRELPNPYHTGYEVRLITLIRYGDGGSETRTRFHSCFLWAACQLELIFS